MNPRSAVLWTALILVLPRPAEAFEIHGGVSVGGFLAGLSPHLAVTPQAGIGWRAENGLMFALHDLFSILPATNGDGAGAYNQTSAVIGYASEKYEFNGGPSFSAYSIPSCGAVWCGRTGGVAAGGHAQASVYFSEAFGLSLSGNIDWLGGPNALRTNTVVATIIAGPVLRWRMK